MHPNGKMMPPIVIETDPYDSQRLPESSAVDPASLSSGELVQRIQQEGLVGLAGAAGMAVGFAIALIMLGSIREILGSGTLFGVDLFGPSFEPWVIMILPPGGFITLGLLLGVFAVVKERREQAAQAAEAAVSEQGVA